MAITVKLANGTQHSVDVSDFGVTVAELKKQLSSALEIPADEQRVILRGKVLKDDGVLSAVGMEDGSVIHVVRSKKAAASAPSATPTSASAVTSSQTPSAPAPPTAASQPSQAETPANPYAALMSTFGASQPQQPFGGGNAFSAPGNPYAQMGMEGPGNPSPQQAAEMMQNPMMQQMMQQALNDPQFTQYIIQSSPQLAALPPAQQQAVVQMMRNPYMMQQAMAMMGSGAAGGGGMPNFGQPANQQNSNSVVPMAGFNPAMFAPPPPQGNPREIYREQLQQLREMGFPNEEANIAALQQAQGNLQFALERLLGA
ncbi:putative ubiquitin-like protein [Leptomonas pyrrhocoris]|uniref:Putative ubiquitin-like protein n=1 Tax=Leptomonas pyrrhocoris TaxID=157538 RepID=A0A0M9G0V6_LEPPY|nr:putative ubiquitin-like protein [Leptomonas pyrrhocoris]XP_015658336.1 putative ubiquitin-like protein [Leptomonas pyrrhocoris]KPA79896.1 putative ubiquitin-like protein [Leptomonas pyrrhocoris]KPA79897.1 putative ubiquitin-like protein [Leptomonas pyrrhocoris]|eukprot:XP_015658335.1 putative ubiquitin-like protein [Leptomonas pyrrhocoris]